MPQGITLTTADMMEMVELYPTPDFFLRQFFVETQQNSLYATWDVYNRARTVGNYTRIGGPSQRIARRPLYSMSFKMGHQRYSKAVEAQRKYERKPGTPNTPWSLDDQLAKELEDLNRVVEYTKEFERSSLLFSGVLSMTYNTGETVVADFMTSNAAHRYAADGAWTVVTCDVVGHLQSAAHVIKRDAGLPPMWAIGGEGFLNVLMVNSALTSWWRHSPYGMRALERGELPIWNNIRFLEYSDLYENSLGSIVPFCPVGAVAIVANPREIGLEYRTGISPEMDANVPGKFPKTWKEEDPSGQQVLLDVVGLPLVEVPQGIVVITGCWS